VLHDLDLVAVRVCDPRDQQPAEPLVKRLDPRDAIGRELGVGLSGVACPEDDCCPLAAGYGLEAVVVAGGRHRSDSDLVPVEDEVDVNRFALRGDSEGFGEATSE
jgi:hypothetical protein